MTASSYKRDLILDPAWTSQPIRSLRKAGWSPANTTSSANPSSASAAFRRNPCNLRRICERRRVHLSRKAHLRSIRSRETLEVQTVSKLPRLDTTITFSDFDMEGCQHPHDNLLVIKTIVANKTIHRVLVDNGSSADIIFASAFDKKGIGREKLEPVNVCLHEFSRERVLPLGSVQLVLTLGDPPNQATTTLRFLIVNAPSAYNMLLGRPSLNAIRVVPSAYHMVIKFPTANGVGMVRGNQRIARECYSASMK